MSDTGPDTDTPAIRDAATVILWRDTSQGPAVLMGQRGAGAAFMPSKYVFPGGGLDALDATVPLARGLDARCAARLDLRSSAGMGPALAACAIRELWEEAGLILGTPGTWAGDVPDDWKAFAESGHRPDAGHFSFVFRAITPPGRTRRFDARFFLAPAAAVAGDPDDFSAASDELSHLHWVALSEARQLNLPFITEVVLAEVSALIARGGRPDSVPFFDNSASRPAFRRLD